AAAGRSASRSSACRSAAGPAVRSGWNLRLGTVLGPGHAARPGPSFSIEDGPDRALHLLEVLAFVPGQPVAEEACGLLHGSAGRDGDHGDAFPVGGLHRIQDGEQLRATRRECLERGREVRTVVAGLALPFARAKASPGRALLRDDPRDVAAEDVLARAQVSEEVDGRPF